MGDKTKIPWTEATWNPVVGCTKVSPGCDNCYAERMACRLAYMGQEKYQKVTGYVGDWDHWLGKTYCDEKALEIPLHWRKPRQIFVPSMGDLSLAPYEFFVKVMTVIKQCKQHTFQILTKRPEILLQYCTSLYEHGSPPENLWLGVTVCVPDEKHKIDTLRKIPAAVKFLSIEPCLADMGELNLEGIGWVIVGVESGPGARHCNINWIYPIVHQCGLAGVPVFVKQIHMWKLNGELFATENELRSHYGQECNPKRVLIKDINQFPEDLRIRQYPKKGGD